MLNTQCVFHLPELTGKTAQSVNQTRHFEGMVLQNLGPRYVKEIRRTSIELKILDIVTQYDP